MKRIYLSAPSVGEPESQALQRALESGWVAPLGPEVSAFEQELSQCGQRPGAAALASGTAALHLALQLCGVSAGDEVLCSTLTFVASASPIVYLGAQPRFVDSEKASWNLDPTRVEAALGRAKQEGRRVAAVIAVDLYGQCADYRRLTAICDAYQVPLIEDAAESLGASHDLGAAGSFGAFSVFSFNGNKIITTSGGGALLGEVDAVERARWLASQAREPKAHYEHRELGFNYRMSNLLAALGRAQLGQLKTKVERRRAIFRRYREDLEGRHGLRFQPEAPWAQHSRWLSCAQLDPSSGIEPEALRVRLEQEGVEMRQVWKPMHRQPLFEGAPVEGGEVADALFKHGICLPSGDGMSDEDQGRVIETLKSALDAEARGVER